MEKSKFHLFLQKIQGVSKNRKEYWERLQSLSELENSLLIRQLPFTRSIQQ